MPALLPTYPPFPATFVRAQGDRLFDADGNAWWDLYGGHCVTATGHCHPHVVEAISRQAGEFLFYSAAARLPVRELAAERLIAYAATSGMSSVFFCNSGAEANENALKLALKLTGRKRLASTAGGWHGRTLLCLSVTDDPPITSPYAEHLVACERVPFNDVAALDSVDWAGIAAFIVEPVQSMSGVRMASQEFLARARELTAAHGVLLIFDEIQTGFGRLGAAFAAELYGVRPDLISCAKAIASGVPMGALLMSAEVASRVGPGDLGSTFGGGPLACAALIATLEVISSENLAQQALDGERTLRSALTNHRWVRAIRGAGLLLGLDCGAHAAAIKRHLISHRVLVGGSSDPSVLRLMPPLNLSAEAMAALLSALDAFAPEMST